MTVSAIVPFYNEEKSVGKVVATLLASPLVSEIICINDGSTDNSLKVLEKYNRKITVITFSENQGKGKCVGEGIKKARGTYLLFCDADLIRFTVDHVRQMLEPILQGKTSVVFAVPTLQKTGAYSRHEVFLAGERVYPRSALLPHVGKLSRSKGAGASEIFLNTLFKKKDVKIVPLIGLDKPSKDKKWNAPTALRQYILSVIGVLQEAGRIEIHSVGDFRQLENLLQVDTVEKLASSIHGIKNSALRKVLETYYAKYIAIYVKKIMYADNR